MTQRPYRQSVESALAFTLDRTRYLERQQGGPWIYIGLGTLLNDGTFDNVIPDETEENLGSNPGTGSFTIPGPYFSFQNGWFNVGGGKQRLRIRWVHPLGSGIDIEGSLDGGGIGTVITTLPPGPFYRPDDGEIQLTCHDNFSNIVVVRVLPTGEVIGGL